MMITDEHCLELAEASQKGFYSIQAIRFFLLEFDDFVSRGFDPTSVVVCGNNCGRAVKFTKDQKDNGSPWSMIHLVSANCVVCIHCYTGLMIRGMEVRIDRRKRED